jgi:hypothetical protein
MKDLEYVVSWTTTEVTEHTVVVSVAKYAAMARVPVATVAECGMDERAVAALDDDLENGLADVEGQDTATEYYELNREVRHVFVRPAVG